MFYDVHLKAVAPVHAALDVMGDMRRLYRDGAPGWSVREVGRLWIRHGHDFDVMRLGLLVRVEARDREDAERRARAVAPAVSAPGWILDLSSLHVGIERTDCMGLGSGAGASVV